MGNQWILLTIKMIEHIRFQNYKRMEFLIFFSELLNTAATKKSSEKILCRRQKECLPLEEFFYLILNISSLLGQRNLSLSSLFYEFVHRNEIRVSWEVCFPFCTIKIFLGSLFICLRNLISIWKYRNVYEIV